MKNKSETKVKLHEIEIEIEISFSLLFSFVCLFAFFAYKQTFPYIFLFVFQFQFFSLFVLHFNFFSLFIFGSQNSCVKNGGDHQIDFQWVPQNFLVLITHFKRESGPKMGNLSCIAVNLWNLWGHQNRVIIAYFSLNIRKLIMQNLYISFLYLF